MSTKLPALPLLLMSIACSEGPLPAPPLEAISGASGTSSMAGAASNWGGAGGVLAGSGGMSDATGDQAGTGGGATFAGSGGATTAAGAAAGGASTGGGPPMVPPCATNLLSMCSGSPPACHFGGEPGNYEVTVQLGAGQNEVEAEYYRRMLTVTSESSDAWFSFITNVRVYEGEPLRPDQDNTTSKGIPGLDVYFRGASPSPKAICFRRHERPLMLWLEGDSTVTDQESTAFSGWGQHLPQHFVSPVSVANYADSGESSGSVLNSPKLWGTIKAGMKAGDWVMLQVGHNDKTTSAATFEANLVRMVDDTRDAGAHMILVTPISRANGALAQQHVNSVGANLPQIIRNLGKRENLPVIDLTVTSWNWLQTIEWQDYFANGTDPTHTNPKGANVISGFVRDAVRVQAPELAKYLR